MSKNTSNAEICMSSSTCSAFCASTGSARTCLSQLAGYSRDTRDFEDDDVFRASFLESHCPPQFVWLFFICCLRCERISFRHLFIFPGSIDTSAAWYVPCTFRFSPDATDPTSATRALFFSLSFALCRRFCLCMQSSLLFLSRFSQYLF